MTNRCELSIYSGSDPIYVNEDTEKTTADGKCFLILLTAHAFMYKIEDILIDRIYFVQWP